MAIKAQPAKKATLQQINDWLISNFQFFRGEYNGWKTELGMDVGWIVHKYWTWWYGKTKGVASKTIEAGSNLTFVIPKNLEPISVFIVEGNHITTSVALESDDLLNII